MTRVVAILLTATLGGAARAQSVDDIVHAYTNAVGGQAAITRIHTRKAQISHHHGVHITLYWASPDKVLRAGRQEKEGFDGATGWVQTKKKRIQKLPHGRLDELETDANPIRYVRLRDLYHELNMDKPATVEGVLMDVISAPNGIGATRFYFDHASHLLVRIEEFGVTSAYYKHTILFDDYEELDGIRIPTRIRRMSDEPGAEKADLHLTNIQQNVEVATVTFKKPDVGPLVEGGKF